ncbi:MAG TPA: VCBS repeat-containing protein [Candidatus Acidoferrales bacterium]|nr:VCBS repeat-containing protein [Candidatus Acidoferrales bacterium]
MALLSAAVALLDAGGAEAQPPPNSARFARVVIDDLAESNSHKPKVLARFSKDGFNDLGSLDSHGFKLYRYVDHWKAYTIFQPGDPGGFEDAVVADINGDGWNDIILGGWGNRTIWAENPAGQGLDPYTHSWRVHVVDSTRFSHELCAADLNHDGRCDIVTTSGLYFQGATPDAWTFVNIGRSGQGTQVGNVLANDDGYNDVIAVYQSGGTNQIAWFENPGHTGGDPVHSHWSIHVIDSNPGGTTGANRDMDELAFAFGDINGDGRPDLVAASMGEGPDPGDDNRQVGDGLVWYEAPANPRTGSWHKHVIDPAVAWVHASSLQLADFAGDGHRSICYAEQDQSSHRKDGRPSRQLGILYNVKGDGSKWKMQVLSQYPDFGAGGFNSRVGIIGRDRLPSIFTSLHGYFGDPNPLLLWRSAE